MGLIELRWLGIGRRVLPRLTHQTQRDLGIVRVVAFANTDLARLRRAVLSLCVSSALMLAAVSIVHAGEVSSPLKRGSHLFLAQVLENSGRGLNQTTRSTATAKPSPSAERYSLSRGGSSRYDLIQDSSLMRDFALRSGASGFQRGLGIQTFAAPPTVSSLSPLGNGNLFRLVVRLRCTSAYELG